MSKKEKDSWEQWKKERYKQWTGAQWKQHKKDLKAYKKEVIKFAKEASPWCNLTYDFLDIQIKYWIKYYSLGVNVYSKEDLEYQDGQTRLEIAKEMQRLLWRWDMFGSGLTDAEIAEYQADPWAFPDGLFKNRHKEFWAKYYQYDENKNIIYVQPEGQFDKDQDQVRKEFFDYYTKYEFFMND